MIRNHGEQPVYHVQGSIGIVAAEQIVVVQYLVQVVQHFTRVIAWINGPDAHVKVVKTIIEAAK